MRRMVRESFHGYVDTSLLLSLTAYQLVIAFIESVQLEFDSIY